MIAGGPMIPVHMGIMAPTSAVMVTSMPVLSKPPVPRKDIAAMRAKENDENSGPTTTVFVGNISEKASDMLIRQLLAVRDRKRYSHWVTLKKMVSVHGIGFYNNIV